MGFKEILYEQPLILSECAVSERLRRFADISLHPTLFNTPLIYDQNGRNRLAEVYRSYMAVAHEAGLPILLCAPTWRVDRDRVDEAGVPVSINRDAVRFMRELKKNHGSENLHMNAGALLAPRNDCYSPDAALSRQQAAEFHAWQIGELIEAEAEVVIAQTMPALSESLGMADRLASAGRPYIISFVINRNGLVLDGTPLAEAIERVDQEVAAAPLGYMVNCVYPTFVNADSQPPELFKRLIGIQANASSLDHQQLDGSETAIQDPLEDWTAHMVKLNRNHSMKILGGCCGTDDTYLRSITQSLR
jgi:homocysteine S-methyltransferase